MRKKFWSLAIAAMLTVDIAATGLVWKPGPARTYPRRRGQSPIQSVDSTADWD